ncbi:winged helix-turn-helix transcriptional regulator [Catellatospora sichuanensis]|uniref:winged helix-turn-helix transcriptional regulator n=1 Tax=Catellatospora sichuanensis TaxID=1969805 RepID=UPI001182C1CA|nr:helix-turn-helix domain-containing protein [Catellatospora sichuanensis]
MRPTALDWSAENCTVARAMAVLGERWTLVVLREVFNGIRRFEDMREHSGIPRQVLTNRLNMLVEQGVLRRVPYREPGERERHEYRLTEKGFDLYPVLVAVREWGDRYLADPAGPPVDMVHRDCGSPVHTSLACAEGHEVGSPREVVTRPGPGAIRRGRTPAAAEAA